MYLMTIPHMFYDGRPLEMMQPLILPAVNLLLHKVLYIMG